MYKKTILSDSAFVCCRKMTLQNVVITSSAVCCSDPIFPSVTSRVLPTKQKLKYFLFWKVENSCNLYIVEVCLKNEKKEKKKEKYVCILTAVVVTLYSGHLGTVQG